MCGICGVVSFRGPLGDGGPSVRRMLGQLRHRGPDDTGTHLTATACFGAQRLAIRGLADGRQPIVDRANGIVAVCNGEIDNHLEIRRLLERSGRPVAQATDVAVLPGLYLEQGEAFVEELDGVFALALWDMRHRTLLLARDRTGERPLFYREAGGTIRFATEIAALRAGLVAEPTIDRRALAGYFGRGCFLAPSTPFEGIAKVAPGQLLRFTEQGVTRRQYWRWPIVTQAKSAGRPETFDAILSEAFRRQSSIEVDYGIFLSGGLDSSLVAAIARAVRPERRPPAYTLRFAEHSFDEGDHARRVAGFLGLEMVSVSVGPEMLAAELPQLVGLVGEPLADPAWIPTALLARRAAQDVRLVFSGEGADELFGGYPTYLAAQLAPLYRRLPASVRRGVRALAERLPPSERKMTLPFLLKRFVEVEALRPMARHQRWTAAMPAAVREELGLPPEPPPIEAWSGELLDELQLHDLETTLAEGLLTKADRAGMARSLEIRSPYLDRTVMEFAAGLPVRERIDGTTTKAFLKRYALAYLPRDIVRRRKRGLSIPLDAWLRRPLQSWARERLRDGRLDAAGIRVDRALGLLDRHVAQEANHGRALWALLVLDAWLDWTARPQQHASDPVEDRRCA